MLPSAPAARLPERPWWRDTWFLGVVGLALVLRIGAVLLFAHTPQGVPDPASYWIAGQSIADGDGYRSMVGQLMAHYPPGYPYFLGGLLAVVQFVGLSGNAATVVGLVQAVMGAATVAIVILAAREWSGRAVALTAGLLLAVWPSQVLYPAAILSETLYLFLFAVFLFAVIRACRAPASAWPWIGAAAVFAGLSTLVRPQGIVISLPLLAVAWLIGGLGWRRTVGWSAAIAIGVVAVVAPWTVRNYQVFGAVVPISTNTWSNMCIGFEPRARGHFAFAPECVTGEFYDKGPASELRNEQILAPRVIGFIVDDPARLPLLSLNKLRYTFGIEVDAFDGVEVYGYSPVVSDPTRRHIYIVSGLFYYPLLVLSIVGLAVTIRRVWRDRRGEVASLSLLALTAGAVLAPVLFFGDSRFKVPAAPMMVMLAAAVLVGAWRRRPGSAIRATDTMGRPTARAPGTGSGGWRAAPVEEGSP